MSEHPVPIPLELGHVVSDQALFWTALTHASYAHEHAVPHNERLEFLGDAVLQTCATEVLFEQHPTASEGTLSRIRARIVNTETLALAATQMGVPQVLRLGVGERADGGQARPRVLAGAFEALLGAVFLDGGFPAARRCVRQWLDAAFASVSSDDPLAWKDSRSALQELLQDECGHTPMYRVIEQHGAAHRPTFVVEVSVGERVLATGQGPSKREASHDAARQALQDRGIDS